MLLFDLARFASSVAVLHTSAASVVFWCGLIRHFLIATRWFRLVTISCVTNWWATFVKYLFRIHFLCDIVLVHWFLVLWWVKIGKVVAFNSILVAIEVAFVVIEVTSFCIVDIYAFYESSPVVELVVTSLLSIETVVAGSWSLVAGNVEGIDVLGQICLLFIQFVFLLC